MAVGSSEEDPMQAVDAPMTTAPQSANDTFDRKTFGRLAGAGMLVGLSLPTIGFFAFAGTVPATDDLATRLTLAIRFMAFPVLAVVLGFMAAANARLASSSVDGSAPPSGSSLELHRRYLQNTLEQFCYFFITQMALVTVLPATALHLVPLFCVQFLIGRLLFWRGYLANPAYRSFGLAMNHVNLLVLAYVIFRVVGG